MKKFPALLLVFIVAMLGTGVIHNRYSPQKEDVVLRKDYAAYLKAVFPAHSRQIFDVGDLTIYSLEASDGGYEGANTFHGSKVLGSAKLTSDGAAKLRSAFYTNAPKDGIGALCFWPRMGIRAQQGNQTLDLLICFECGHIDSCYGDKQVENQFSSQGRESFKDIYKQAGLQLDKTGR